MANAETQPLINPTEDDSLGPLPYQSVDRRDYSESVLTTATTATSMTDQAPLFDAIDETEANEDEEQAQTGPAQAERISTLQAFANLFKSNLGTGILAMPYAFRTSGLGLGAVLITIMGVVSVYCMHQLRNASILLRSKHDLDQSKMDYGETAKAAFRFGPEALRPHYRKAKMLVNAFIVIVQFGFCCVYVLFMAQNIQSFVKQVTTDDFTMDVKIYAAIVLAFLLPYCVVKKLRKLTIFSYIASVMTVIGLVLILIYCFQNLHDVRQFSFANDVSELPLALGIIMYSFEAISLVLPIENKMTNPEDYGGFLGVLNVSMMILVLLYILVGFFGYLGFAELTESTITVNIPLVPWWFALVKPMFIICIFVSYGLQFYVPAYVLLRPVDRRVPNRQHRKWIYRAIKALMIVFTFCVAIAIPHLELLISLIGSSISTALALIFPPLIQLITLWPERAERRFFWALVAKDVAISVFGLACCGYGTALTLKQIVHAFRDGRDS